MSKLSHAQPRPERRPLSDGYAKLEKALADVPAEAEHGPLAMTLQLWGLPGELRRKHRTR
jgi:hypothetical protein